MTNIQLKAVSKAVSKGLKNGLGLDGIMSLVVTYEDLCLTSRMMGCRRL